MKGEGGGGGERGGVRKRKLFYNPIFAKIDCNKFLSHTVNTSPSIYFLLADIVWMFI